MHDYLCIKGPPYTTALGFPMALYSKFLRLLLVIYTDGGIEDDSSSLAYLMFKLMPTLYNERESNKGVADARLGNTSSILLDVYNGDDELNPI